MGKKVQEYNDLREQAKLIKERMDTLATEIKDYSTKFGVEDDKGSKYLESEGFIYGCQIKKSINFNNDVAIPFFKQKGLTKAVKTVTTETINEKAVEKYIEEEKLTYAELESITTTKASFSVYVKAKEEMPEVEVKNVAMEKKSIFPRKKK